MLPEFKSIFDLLKAFPTEQECINHLEKLMWEGNPVSPFDATSKVYKCAGNKYKCKNTGKYFNVRTNTIFDNTKIPLQKWFMALYVFSSHKKGISSHQLAKDISVTQKSAWFLLHRLRYAFDHPNFKAVMSDEIELDETFVGGKNKNRHKDKKVEKSQGRSFKDKTPVLGMFEREESHIIERPNKNDEAKTIKEKVITKPARLICAVIPDTKAASIQPIIKNNVEFGSSIFSDEWHGYHGLESHYIHSIVDHARGQYVNGNATTNRIEGVWSHFKRNLIGIYHNVSKSHLQRYADEFTLRYNTRDLKTQERFNLVLAGADGKRLTYKDLTS